MSIASEIARLQSAKAAIRAALIEKGVSVPANATFDQFASYVSRIPTSPNDTEEPEIDPDDVANGHAWVDLGLRDSSGNRILFATEQLGGSNNDTYFWAGTTPAIEGDQAPYEDGFEADGSTVAYSKYNDSDGKTRLDPEDDAAHVNWGGNWRMPTTAELQFLVDHFDHYEVGEADSGTLYTNLFFDINDNCLQIPIYVDFFYGEGGQYFMSSEISSGQVAFLSVSTNDGQTMLGPTLVSGLRKVPFNVLPVLVVPSGSSTPVEPDPVEPEPELEPIVVDPELSNGHDYIDLGITLNGNRVLFGTTVIRSVSDGSYFAWGGTKPISGTYSPGDAPYNEGDVYDENNPEWTKYNSTDGKTTLELSDDAAAANWGGGWRTPTTEELQLLADHFDHYEIDSNNDNQGKLYFDVNNNYISIDNATWSLDYPTIMGSQLSEPNMAYMLSVVFEPNTWPPESDTLEISSVNRTSLVQVLPVLVVPESE